MCFLRKLSWKVEVKLSRVSYTFFPPPPSSVSANSNQSRSHGGVRSLLITNPSLPVSPIDCLFVAIFDRETVLLLNAAKERFVCSLLRIDHEDERLFRENYPVQCEYRG